MADLGTIDTVDVGRGTQPVSRNAELGALNTGLTLAGKVVDEAARADLRGDLAEAQQAAVDTIGQATDEPESNQLVPNSELTERGTAVLDFANNMRRHQAMAKQSSSSAIRTRAVIAMQQELQHAKNKYPWMRAELDQEASRFMSNNPTLSQLGMIDAAINAGTSDAAESQATIDRIAAVAYGNGPGQLGIDPSTPIGSLAFAKQYQQKMQLKQDILSLNQEEELVQAQEYSDVRAAVSVYQRQLEDPAGTVTQFYNYVSSELTDIVKSDLAFNAGKMSESEHLARKQDFNDRLPHLLARIEGAQLAMEDQWNKFPVALREHADAQSVRKGIDQHKADLQTMGELLEAGVTDVKVLIDTVSLMRAQKRFEKAPLLQELSDFGRIAPKVLEMWGNPDYDYTSAHDRYLIQKGMGPQIMTHMFPTMAGAYLEAGGAETSEQVLNQYDAAAERGNSPGRITSNDPIDRANDSMGQLDRLRGDLKELQNDLAQPALHDPVADTMFVNQGTKLLANLTQSSVQYDEEAKVEMRDKWTDPNWWDVMERDGLGSETGAQAWALAMKDRYFKTVDKPADLLRGVAEATQTQLRGMNRTNIPVMSVITVDSERLASDGELVFRADSGLVDQLYPAPNTSGPRGDQVMLAVNKKQNERLKVEALEEATRVAEQLTRDVTDHLQMQAKVHQIENYATMRSPNYTLFFTDEVGGLSIASILQATHEE